MYVLRIAMMMIALTAVVSLGFADEAPPQSEPKNVDQPKKPKRRHVREKEAEGTQAPNRFDADINLKSKYEYNGKSLEVDTD